MVKKKAAVLQRSKTVKKHAQILCLLSKLSPKVINSIIQNSDNGLIKTISSCSSDILNGYLPLTNIQKKRLSRYRYTLRRLVEHNTSLKDKKALLMKGGSMLPMLISTIAPFLIKSFLPKLFSVIKPKRKTKK